MEKNYGKRLKELREERQLKQTAVANILSIKQNTYSQYERGERQIPIEALVKLSVYYGVSVDYILGLTEIDMPYPKQ